MMLRDRDRTLSARLLAGRHWYPWDRFPWEVPTVVEADDELAQLIRSDSNAVWQVDTDREWPPVPESEPWPSEHDRAIEPFTKQQRRRRPVAILAPRCVRGERPHTYQATTGLEAACTQCGRVVAYKRSAT